MDETPSSSNESRNPPPLAESLPESSNTGAVAPKPASSRRPERSAPSPALDAKLRQANLLRVRGDIPGALKELAEALEIDGADVSVLEMSGDLLMQLGLTDDALARFRKAQELGAGASVEAKIARILYQQKSTAGGRSIDDAPLIRGQGCLAIAASLLIPGLGLAISGEFARAAIAFFGCILPVALMFAIPASRDAVEATTGRGPAASPVGQFLVVFLGLVNLAFYIYSVAETARLTRAAGKDG